MSNFDANNALQTTQRQVIDSIIGAHFFADYGIIQAINEDKTVNVAHVIKSVLLNGTTLPPIVTNNVEVMQLGAIAFQIDFPVQIGDLVLLIGLRNYVPALNGITAPEDPLVFLHYEQETLKAIPMGIVSTSGVSVKIDDDGNLVVKNDNSTGNVQLQAQTGKFQIKNLTQSLYTQLETLETALSAFMGPTAQAAITSGGASSASLAEALVDLMVTFTSATSTMLADLAALLEA